MRRTFARITLTAAATAGLVAAGLVQALGLGEIDVKSDLNQRFNARIQLTEINAEDLETVTVSVAPNEAFERAGIERAEYLSSLNFEVRNDHSRPQVIISSSEIAREPVLHLLVQARWSGGKILRDYTILLDPSTLAAPVVAKATVTEKAPAPAAVPMARSASRIPAIAASKSEFYETPAESKPPKNPVAPIKAAPAATDPAFDSATGSYGPVVAGETLWSIATKVRPSPIVSMDQVLLALSQANPLTIQRGTTVNKGATLRIPSPERMQSTTALLAKAKLADLRSGGTAGTKAAALPKAVAIGKAPNTPPAKVTKPTAPAAARPELPKPQLAVPPAADTATAPASPSVPTSGAAISAPIIAAEPPEPVKPVASAAAAAVPPEAVATVSAALPAAAPAVPAELASAAPPTAVAPATPLPTAVPVAAKSPLAQPLPAEPESSLLEDLATPLAVGGLVLLLGGGLLLRSRRRKVGAAAGSSFTKFKPGDTSTAQVAAGAVGVPSKLGDTKRLSDTQVLGAGSAAFALAADATQQMTQPLAAAASAYAPEATLILDPAAVAALNNAVKPSAVSGGAESFDKTTQVQVDTLQINLGDNDPLSEADFHLAYGLYDEAILLLKTATQQQPLRADLQVKLAETYFAAGRPIEFQEIAEEIKDRLSSTEWSKIAIMGAQICPDASLFQSGGGDAGLDADFDLAFDEPDAPTPVAPLPASATGNRIDFSIATPAIAQGASSAVLDLDLGDDTAASLNQSPAGLDDEASIDFMLGQSLTPLGAGLNTSASSDPSFKPGAPSLAVKMSELELAASLTAIDIEMAEINDRPTLTPISNAISLSLQDLAVSITPRANMAESLEDELNTKLDLARAYVEMGDNEMAKSLLQEVQQQGGDRHQQEAASLLQRLPG